MKNKSQKKSNLHKNELNTRFFLFDDPLKGSKSRKIFKINLTFRFDKLSHLSKSVHTGENSQILTVSNKKNVSVTVKNIVIVYYFKLIKTC
jgi:replication initiation and membrane attachment protein DnaB